MADVVVRCRMNGPLLVEGPVTIVDHLGNAFAIAEGKPAVALCRCGQSAHKPFCDGNHRVANFRAEETATPPTA